MQQLGKHKLVHKETAIEKKGIIENAKLPALSCCLIQQFSLLHA